MILSCTTLLFTVLAVTPSIIHWKRSGRRGEAAAAQFLETCGRARITRSEAAVFSARLLRREELCHVAALISAACVAAFTMMDGARFSWPVCLSMMFDMVVSLFSSMIPACWILAASFAREERQFAQTLQFRMGGTAK